MRGFILIKNSQKVYYHDFFRKFMMTSFDNEYEENECDFSQEIDQILDDTIGERVPESDRIKFKKNLLFIVRQNANKLCQEAQNNYTKNKNTLTHTNTHNTSKPIINIYFLNQPGIRPINNPPIYQPLNSSMISSPLIPNNTSPYQIPMQMQPPIMPYQQQLFNPSMQIQQEISRHSKNSHHKEKSKKHHNDKKSSKKAKKSSKKDEDKNYTIEKIDYKEGQDFQGIFNFLKQKFGLNPHDKGEIQITTNFINTTHSSEDSHPKNLLDSNLPKNFKSKGLQTDVWICFDFKRMKIEVSSYTIKSSSNSLGHVRNWIIEISNDQNKWETIDQQNECKFMDRPKAVKNFTVSNDKNKFARFVRFHHNGDYWGYRPGSGSNSTYIEFNAIEFFGKIKIPK